MAILNWKQVKSCDKKRYKLSNVTYPLPARYLAAGLFLAILPAGEIWSVVTESPKFNNTHASFIP